MKHLSAYITKKPLSLYVINLNITFAFRYCEGILKYHLIKTVSLPFLPHGKKRPNFSLYYVELVDTYTPIQEYLANFRNSCSEGFVIQIN